MNASGLPQADAAKPRRQRTTRRFRDSWFICRWAASRCCCGGSRGGRRSRSRRTALVFNLFILPRFAHALYRRGDRDRPIHGIVLYPLAVLVLIATFPRRPDIAAAAWGILAAGDGIATLAGRAIGGPRWPWSPDKTVAGTLAFVIGGSIAGCGLAWWCRPAGDPAAPMLFALLAPPVAAVAAGFVETIPVRLDDNLTVAASAGATLWLVALVCARYAATLDSYLPLPPQGAGYQSFSEVSVPLMPVAAALVTNAAAAAAGYAAKSVGRSGAIGGAIIGMAIFLALGWQGWTLLFVTFLAATIATRTGRARKQQLGIAEERGGRRGAGNAIANTGVAAIAATLAGLDVHPGAAQLAFVTALVAGGSDTIASEMGKAYGRRTYSITSLSRVAPGTSGAMSIEGTAAGVIGAIGLSGVAIALGLLALPVASARRHLCNDRRTRGKLARRNIGRARHPQQRHAELPEHGRRVQEPL